jgi:hypothetical protein
MPALVGLAAVGMEEAHELALVHGGLITSSTARAARDRRRTGEERRREEACDDHDAPPAGTNLAAARHP